MARARANKAFNTFVQGLITEASPLTFPENATIDEDNFILNRNGSRRRRLGIDYEQDGVLTDFGKTAAQFATDAVSSHVWTNVNDNADVALTIIQVGLDLYFFDLLKDPVTGSPKNGGSKLTIEGDATRVIQTTVVAGDLVIVSGAKEINVLKYNATTDVVTRESHGLLVRDIWGVDDGLDVDERPTALSQTHKYNLINQGWGDVNPDSSIIYYQQFKDGAGTNTFPSNADVVSTGIDPTQSNIFDARFVARTFFGSTPAPKGHLVLDIFERGASRSKAAGSDTTLRTNYGISFWGTGISGAFSLLDLTAIPDFSGIPTDRTDSGITTTATFAGRAFYSGMQSELIGGDSKSPLLGSYVLFSQIVDNAEKLALCHQEADPTSNEISDLIDTDGGIIKIPEMSRCLKLINIGRSIVVVAENGVWEISGGEENFSATNIQVSKVSNVGAVSSEAIINAEGIVFYWSKGGVYQLQVESVSQRVTASNISEETIQTFFDNIPAVAKANATGSYDPAAKKLQWLYSDTSDYDGINERFKYNRTLTIDLTLGAFYPGTVGSVATDSPYTAGFLVTPNFVSADVVFDIVVGAEDVVTNGGDNDVVVTDEVRTIGKSRTKYLTIKPSTASTYKFTLSLERDDTFVDWKTDDATGVDAPAFMLTGYELLGDTQREKQVPYLTAHFERTETGFETVGGQLEAKNPSSCLVQTQWDFADNTLSGKFSGQFEAYRLLRNFIPTGVGDTFTYGYRVITTKTPLRGTGKAISLRFDSSAGKDLFLLGWAINADGNTDV